MHYLAAILIAVVIWALDPAKLASGDTGPTSALDLDIGTLKRWDFLAFDPEYDSNRALREARLDELEARLFEAQAAGNAIACSNQIFIEAQWLLHYTADWPRLDRRLDDLATSLENEDQQFALQQSANDGAWGVCYEEWFHKLDASIDGLNELVEQGGSPMHEFIFLKPIGSSDALIAYLNRLLVSDVASTGRDNRDELGAVTAVLSQILFKKRLRKMFDKHVKGLELTDAYMDAYRGFLDSWQDSRTGYWGAWYRSGGKVRKSADLSFTYHTVTYRHGQVRYLPQIVETTLAIKDKTYPYGWLHDGKYNNHNNYDIVRIFGFGWHVMSQAQREAARVEISALLDWAVSESLRPDGSFVVDLTFYNRISDVYYYGVSFLDAAGYWHKSKRFWTDADFPEAATLCRTIRSRLESLNLDDASSEAALEKLEIC